MITAIAAIITAIAGGVKLWFYFYKKKRTKPTYAEDIQSLHNSIAKGDADTLSDLFDGVRRPPGKGNKVGYDDSTPS